MFLGIVKLLRIDTFFFFLRKKKYMDNLGGILGICPYFFKKNLAICPCFETI